MKSEYVYFSCSRGKEREAGIRRRRLYMLSGDQLLFSAAILKSRPPPPIYFSFLVPLPLPFIAAVLHSDNT